MAAPDPNTPTTRDTAAPAFGLDSARLTSERPRRARSLAAAPAAPRRIRSANRRPDRRTLAPKKQMVENVNFPYPLRPEGQEPNLHDTVCSLAAQVLQVLQDQVRSRRTHDTQTSILCNIPPRVRWHASRSHTTFFTSTRTRTISTTGQDQSQDLLLLDSTHAKNFSRVRDVDVQIRPSSMSSQPHGSTCTGARERALSRSGL